MTDHINFLETHSGTTKKMGCKLNTAITIFVIISVSFGIIYLNSNSSSNAQSSSIPAEVVQVANDSKDLLPEDLNQLTAKNVLPENDRDPKKEAANFELKPQGAENIIDPKITSTITSTEPEALTDTKPKDTLNLNQDKDRSNLQNHDSSKSAFNSPESQDNVSEINPLSEPEPSREAISDKTNFISGTQGNISTNESIPSSQLDNNLITEEVPPWIQKA